VDRFDDPAGSYLAGDDERPAARDQVAVAELPREHLVADALEVALRAVQRALGRGRPSGGGRGRFAHGELLSSEVRSHGGAPSLSSVRPRRGWAATV
jgi:hypothetical protein